MPVVWDTLREHFYIDVSRRTYGKYTCECLDAIPVIINCVSLQMKKKFIVHIMHRNDKAVRIVNQQNIGRDGVTQMAEERNSQKYWRELNLWLFSQNEANVILTDFSLAVSCITHMHNVTNHTYTYIGEFSFGGVLPQLPFCQI